MDPLAKMRLEMEASVVWGLLDRRRRRSSTSRGSRCLQNFSPMSEIFHCLEARRCPIMGFVEVGEATDDASYARGLRIACSKNITIVKAPLEELQAQFQREQSDAGGFLGCRQLRQFGLAGSLRSWEEVNT